LGWEGAFVGILNIKGYNPFMRQKGWKTPGSSNHKAIRVILALLVGLLLVVIVYYLPPVHDRLAWRVDEVRADIYYFFNPPEQNAFSPQQQAEMSGIVAQTQTAIAPTATATMVPSLTPTNYISPTPTQTATPTPTPTPIPEAVRLEGTVWELEDFNNCGPATLSIALSYWGWEGDQRVTGQYLRPNSRDRNVMPYELVDFVRTQTEYSAILRYGGELDLLKELIAAGFPVLIERGFLEEVPQDWWMGHYQLLTGYDENDEVFIAQDSYVRADYPNTYERIERHWRSFNYAFIVIYPYDKENEVFEILGPHVDEMFNYQYAAQKAVRETAELTGDNLFFAWFNYGTSLQLLNDYYGAAQAYDTAFNDVLSELYEGIDPFYRIMWYQTGPYFAYYYTGRYQDLLNLATKTLNSSFEPAIEETWVWRGRAKVALGDIEGAIEDFREALKWHPGWWVAEAELESLGVTP
jgi:tetratricopeptide (TPR) repeat protein